MKKVHHIISGRLLTNAMCFIDYHQKNDKRLEEYFQSIPVDIMTSSCRITTASLEGFAELVNPVSFMPIPRLVAVCSVCKSVATLNAKVVEQETFCCVRPLVQVANAFQDVPITATYLGVDETSKKIA